MQAAGGKNKKEKTAKASLFYFSIVAIQLFAFYNGPTWKCKRLGAIEKEKQPQLVTIYIYIVAPSRLHFQVSPS